MKKSLFAVLLTLVCAAMCAFCLTACNKDDDKDKEPAAPAAIVVKVGETSINDVTNEPATYAIEAATNKTYTLTAKKDGGVCNDVYLFVGPGANGNGSVEFKYEGQNSYTVKVSAVNETVKGVSLVLAEKTYPVGAAQNPAALTVGTAANYSVGFDAYFYKVTVDEGDSYELTVTGDDAAKLVVKYGTELNGEGDGLIDEYSHEAALVDGKATVGLEAGDNYVMIYSDKTDANGNVLTITGTLKLAEPAVASPVAGPALIEGTPATIESLDGVGVVCAVTGTAGKTYKVTATIDNNPAGAVHLAVSAGVQGDGELEFEYADGVKVTVVYTGSLANLGNVVLTLTEVTVTPPPSENYTEITLGTEYSAEGIYKLVVTTAGVYVIGGDIFVGDGTDFADIQIGTELEGDEMVGLIEIDFTTKETEELAAGTYYVKAWTDDSFSISLKA